MSVKYLTPEQVAMKLDRSAATVWRYVNKGLIKPWYVLGRTVFVESEIDSLAQVVSCRRYFKMAKL